MSAELFEIDESEHRPAPWQERWKWPILSLLAFAVFELTASLSLVAFVFSLKFCWKETQIAVWMSRRDPDRSRGRTCALFLLAYGFLRVMVVSLLSGVIIATIAASLRQQGVGPVLAGFAGAFFVGMILAGGITLSAILRAYRKQQQVWVDPAIYHSYCVDQWPPLHFSTNRIAEVVSLAQLLTAGLAFILPAALCAGFNWGIGNGPVPVVVGWIAALLGVSMMVIAGLIHTLSERHVRAASPLDCWPELVDINFELPDRIIRRSRSFRLDRTG